MYCVKSISKILHNRFILLLVVVFVNHCIMREHKPSLLTFSTQLSYLLVCVHILYKFICGQVCEKRWLLLRGTAILLLFMLCLSRFFGKFWFSLYSQKTDTKNLHKAIHITTLEHTVQSVHGIALCF